MQIRLTGDEWYPVYQPDENGHLSEDLPDDVVAAYLDALDSFTAARSALHVALKEAQQRAEAAAHQARIEARRAERGQRRPKQRPRPTKELS